MDSTQAAQAEYELLVKQAESAYNERLMDAERIRRQELEHLESWHKARMIMPRDDSNELGCAVCGEPRYKHADAGIGHKFKRP